ncbi:hypothetical protein ACHAW6_006324 [Cyclotella cf. meneghiniana]
MPPSGSAKFTKHKSAKCTTAIVLKLILSVTLALFASSIFVTFNLSTSVKFGDDPTAHAHSLESPRGLRKERETNGIAKNTVPGSQALTNTLTSSEQDLLEWIKGQRKDDKSSSISNLLSTPLEYAPGALPLSQLSTFHHCYTDPSVYSNHLSDGGSKRRAPISEKHKLALVLLPKSGSSTGRFMMQHEFDADERFVSLEPPLNVIAFVREPLSRFFSQYEEAFVRTAPWVKASNPYYIDPSTKKYNQPHPFPYLFENMQSYHDYEDMFCPPSTRFDPNSRRECVDKASAENGTLSRRLERFVRDYDGRNPFDIHLNFQVPLLSNKKGYPIYLTELHNTTNAEGDWKAIAKKYLGEDYEFKNKDGVIEGRSYPRRLNLKLVSAETQRRICGLALIDYCCLNFPLPEVCQDGSGTDKQLFCKIDYDEKAKRVQIQPGLFPDKEKRD